MFLFPLRNGTPILINVLQSTGITWESHGNLIVVIVRLLEIERAVHGLSERSLEATLFRSRRIIAYHINSPKPTEMRSV
jgi:hypothetical protein